MARGPSNVGDPTRVTIEEKPTYANQAREQFRRIREIAQRAYDFDSVADLDGRVEQAAARWRARTGRWPNATELWVDPTFQRSLQTFASGSPYLPPMFWDERGIRYVNDPILGPQPSELSDKFLQSGRTPPFPQNRPDLVIPGWQQIAASLSPIRQPSGGGAGAPGRASVVFDRKQLTNDARERWRGMLLEEPDDTTLNKVVSDYSTEANGFWLNQGGRLDFDTFVVDRIRGQSRYRYLYAKKPEFQSEAEYMSGFRTAVGQFGLNPQATLREVEAGAASGAGIAGFTERVSQTREGRLVGAGTFSNKFAASMAASGLGNT